MTRLLLLVVALCALPAAAIAAPAKPKVIRALFVGIDKYLYSTKNRPEADFGDLKGAVGDAGRIKIALQVAYGLDLDKQVAGKCSSQNAVSITLTDYCATRSAILGGLQKLIDVSAPGDTVIFYYAGHGSQIADDQVSDQASGMNDTILPTDARKPNAESEAEILDRELRGYIDEAVAKGLRVVTIFDSCDSGTATRDLRFHRDSEGNRVIEGDRDSGGRSAPLLRVRGLVRPALPPVRGPGGGYRVHLAASADGTIAREVATTADGQRAGVFTTALVNALGTMRYATFGDIMAVVTLSVVNGRRPGQVPQIEGEVNATMGGGPQAAALFDAAPEGGGVTLAAGQLSDVTEGSTFAFFNTAGDALADDRKPIATGIVTGVDATTAAVKLDAGAPPLSGRLIAREINHSYGRATLVVKIIAERPADKALLVKELSAVPFAQVAESATFRIDVAPLEQPTATLSSADGLSYNDLGPLAAPDFGERLRGALQQVMRAQTILALRTRGGDALPGFCLDNDLDYDPHDCPQKPQGKPFVIASGATAKLTVINTAAVPRHVYVYSIDDESKPNLLLPPTGSKDPALSPNTPITVIVQPDRAGRYRFVTITTADDAPIASARALEQTGARDPGECRSTVERQMCEAASGTSEPGVSTAGAWVATVTDVVVREGEAK